MTSPCHLKVAVEDVETGERLPVEDDGSVADALLLTTLDLR